jgi:Bacterial low temperature requirement A protein (LtrA)
MSEPGKRVSWVELYLDLVFVLAVGQSVCIALGLFVTLWWTWVGFTVLYNRHGDDEPACDCCSWPAASGPASRRSRSRPRRRATPRSSR